MWRRTKDAVAVVSYSIMAECSRVQDIQMSIEILRIARGPLMCHKILWFHCYSTVRVSSVFNYNLSSPYLSIITTVFDMGPTRLCDENFVELRDPLVNGTTRKYCGSDKPAHFKSTGNTAIVHFKSSTNIAGTGWVISFVSAHADQEIIT